ncbi:MAG: hypothetical protein AB2L24_10690 [Mangrovibacterium sp.]
MLRSSQKKPGLSFSLVQTTDPDEEKTLIAVRNAKILYANSIAQSGTDSVRINTTEVNDHDPGFLAFLGLTAEETDVTGERYREICLQRTGSDQVLAEFNQLLEKRQSLLKNYFTEKGLPEGSVRFTTGDLRNLPDEMKKPQFVVEVSME